MSEGYEEITSLWGDNYCLNFRDLSTLFPCDDYQLVFIITGCIAIVVGYLATIAIFVEQYYRNQKRRAKYCKARMELSAEYLEQLREQRHKIIDETALKKCEIKVSPTGEEHEPTEFET
ncbi:unnamed protein product [Bursaphelenchus okinawaensis]|uniref:Uncharacterized protein n=1 Tax=Bursaphelenchus okinawaensis TaxID=465554 RepID=A0A811L8R9_9BILA|nr:unnamed protein product [Bursaphelenchus okinawaensis]CAG9119167.1 unnamed protein product [Bursaphelenchus okinawaensis]